MKDVIRQSMVFNLLRKKMGILGIAAFSLYAGYANQPYLARIEDSLLRKNIPIHQDAFPDPVGLSTKVIIDEEGKKAAYLTHQDERVRIGSYLAPDTYHLVDVLKKRAPGMDKEEARYTLDNLVEIQKELYRKW